MLSSDQIIRKLNFFRVAAEGSGVKTDPQTPSMMPPPTPQPGLDIDPTMVDDKIRNSLLEAIGDEALDTEENTQEEPENWIKTQHTPRELHPNRYVHDEVDRNMEVDLNAPISRPSDEDVSNVFSEDPFELELHQSRVKERQMRGKQNIPQQNKTQKLPALSTAKP